MSEITREITHEVVASTRRKFAGLHGRRGLVLTGLATGICLMLLTGPASSQALFRGGDGIKASATGTVLHAHLLRSGDMRLVDGEVGFTGSAFDSGGLHALFNEVGRKFAALSASKTASALEVGLAITPALDNQLILAGKANAASPGSPGPMTKEIGPVDLSPLAWANLLRGRAMADSAAACTLGSDIGNGVSYVADAQLLDTGGASNSRTSTPVQQPGAIASLTSKLGPLGKTVNGVVSTVQASGLPAPNKTVVRSSTAAHREGMSNPLIAFDALGAPRAVSQSTSRTLLVAQRGRNGKLLGDNFGIMSEVRQTIAPVTLFAGTPNEITIELLGEWVLQAVATGIPGGAYIHYGPGTTSPETPVIRITQAGKAQTILKLQDLLGNTGFVVDIPGLAEIAIGEDARAIGGSATSHPSASANGRSSSAAVDVVRVRALPGATELADIRVGHMEARAQVPAGGVSCPIPVTKTASSNSVNVGDTFHMTYTVSNPYDCTLHNVVISDAVSTAKAARFEIPSADRTASVVTSGSDLASGILVWNDLGDIPPGVSRTVLGTFIAQGGPGSITDRATATATLAGCATPGAVAAGVDVATVGTHMHGLTPVVAVNVGKTEVLAEVITAGPGRLPRTGAPIALYVIIAMALLAVGGAGLTVAHRLRYR